MQPCNIWFIKHINSHIVEDLTQSKLQLPRLYSMGYIVYGIYTTREKLFKFEWEQYSLEPCMSTTFIVLYSWCVIYIRHGYVTNDIKKFDWLKTVCQICLMLVFSHDYIIGGSIWFDGNWSVFTETVVWSAKTYSVRIVYWKEIWKKLYLSFVVSTKSAIHIEAETKWPLFRERKFRGFFSRMNIDEFWLKFHCNVLLWFQLTITQHCFR